MIKKVYDDGSFAELYENGDLVELTKPQGGFLKNEVGEWGAVILSDKKDRERGHTSVISFICVATAGVSTPRDAFQQRISSVPVWQVQLRNKPNGKETR